MPGVRLSLKCVLCNVRTTPKTRRKINDQLEKQINQQFLIPVKSSDVICNKCRHKYFTTNEPQIVCRSNINDNDCDSDDADFCPPTAKACPLVSPPSVRLNIPSTPKSHSRCFLCKRPGPKLVVVSAEARFAAFTDFNVIVKSGTRCCPVHMVEGIIKAEAFTSFTTTESAYVNRATVLELLTRLREACKKCNKRFDLMSLKEDEYIDFTGINKESFDDLCLYVEGHIRNTPTRDVKTSLGIFLFKLKAGLSNKLLSIIFGLTKSSVRRAVKTVRITLKDHFAHMYVGVNHITRQQLIENHTRQLAKSLFTDNAGDSSRLILVIDGTYIYIQKSQNHQFQRRSYSVHKGRPLVKPMVVVTTTGYYLTVLGPYLSDGKNNDAKILNHILDSNMEELKSYIRPGDVFVVDRGFRDSLQLLKELGIQSEMPSLLPKGQSQFDAEEANTSRLVTKIRWIVESANARIKRWKYMDKVLPNSQIPFIGDLIKIICAISNKYLEPLSKSSPEDSIQAQHMLQLATSNNMLKEEIMARGLEKSRAVWEPISNSDLEDFPRLSEDELRGLTCGIYQLKLSPGYIQEHLQGDTDICVHRDDTGLIRIRLQSRHISAKQYTLWLRYTSTEVIGWYCKCKAGARVVGMCAHCAAVVWYLSYARQRYVQIPGVKNWCQYLHDAAEDIPAAIDMSESDTDSE